jgi:hypothetical protein
MPSEEEVPCSLPPHCHYAGNTNLHVAEINNMCHSNHDTESDISADPTAVDDEAITAESAVVNDEAVTKSLADDIIVSTQTRMTNPISRTNTSMMFLQIFPRPSQ